jgi:hypothetical protein
MVQIILATKIVTVIKRRIAYETNIKKYFKNCANHLFVLDYAPLTKTYDIIFRFGAERVNTCSHY